MSVSEMLIVSRLEDWKTQSAAILMHLMNASSAQRSVIEEKGTGTMVREMRPLQDQDSSFFRSGERGEIKSDCNHWR
jgi:hypothetical protein